MKKGDKVVMTELGIRQGLDGKRHSRTGVVVSVSRIAPYVRVKRPDYVTVDRWHKDFWRHT
jgi:hypothetical protein